jgi:hypothetical protein
VPSCCSSLSACSGPADDSRRRPCPHLHVFREELLQSPAVTSKAAGCT